MTLLPKAPPTRFVTGDIVGGRGVGHEVALNIGPAALCDRWKSSISSGFLSLHLHFGNVLFF